MSEGSSAESFTVTCPHCKKQFEGELIEGGADRYRGFKCPHCKLFVPYERADEVESASP
jgi:DNA-directed RNA polymerase subunit RPC12/RpoP